MSQSTLLVMINKTHQLKISLVDDIKILSNSILVRCPPVNILVNCIIPGYYKRNRHFQCCIETKLLII